MHISQFLVWPALLCALNAQAAPEAHALLPPALQAQGLQIAVLDAGFAAPAEKFPDHPELKQQRRALYFFSVGVRAQNGEPIDYEAARRVRFGGLFPQRGARIDGYAAIQGGIWETRKALCWNIT